MIEFAILPPSTTTGNLFLYPLASSINAQHTFKFYKSNPVLYNELLGKKLAQETSLNLLYGEKLYNSPEYIDLKNQEVLFNIPSDYNIYVPDNCYNFIDFQKYINLVKLTKADYHDESKHVFNQKKF